MQQKVTAIFDIGKTNKKFFLFDEHFRDVYHEYKIFPETVDDDGYPCDDIAAIETWMLACFENLRTNNEYLITAINFTAYGATIVNLDKNGKPCTPMYNYLKDFPKDTAALFIGRYGNFENWSKETSSPFLGMLNAGMQLFWLKYNKPSLYKKIDRVLFLPQYLSYVFSKKLNTEFTGIGCHTGMWDFVKKDFHLWMYAEGFDKLLPPVINTAESIITGDNGMRCGIGIHDSSAALVPYLVRETEPFMLLSTGTWCICLNPFNDEPLTTEEFHEDCLCYLKADGGQVKASRYFLGNEFNKWLKRLNEYFNIDSSYHKTIDFDIRLYIRADTIKPAVFVKNNPEETFYFEKQPVTDLSRFDNFDEAYHHLIKELLTVQVMKIKLIEGAIGITKIFVDGGFADNKVFTSMLAEMMPGYIIIPSEEPLGTALGAAMMVADKDVLEKLSFKNNSETISR